MKQANCGGDANTLNGTWRGNRGVKSGRVPRIAAIVWRGNRIDSIFVDNVDKGAAAALAADTVNVRESHSPMALQAASLSIAPAEI